MTNDITYTIRFFSRWHCGSGLSAGADVDNLVVKDKKGMPFIPGRTIKGLVREAAENYIKICNDTDHAEMLAKAFGTEASSSENGTTGCMHFGNAALDEKEYNAIVANNAQEYLYDKWTTTAIDADGTAKEFSLRSMETTVPCTLYGQISDVPQELAEIIANSFGLIKRIGQKRNRGLGRCDVKKGGKQ